MYKRADALIILKELRDPILIHCLLVIFGKPTDPAKHWKVNLKSFLVRAWLTLNTKPSIRPETLRNTLFTVWEVDPLEVYSSHYLKQYGIDEYELTPGLSAALYAWQDNAIEVLLNHPRNEINSYEKLIDELQIFNHDTIEIKTEKLNFVPTVQSLRRADALAILLDLEDFVFRHCILLIFGKNHTLSKQWKIEMSGFLFEAFKARNTKSRIRRETLRNNLFPVWEIESLEAMSCHYLEQYGINEYDVTPDISNALHAWQHSAIELLMKKTFDTESCENLIENLQKLRCE